MDRESRIELYTQGSCHVFAIASHLLHGGDFLVAYDSGETHYVDEDGDEHDVVLHVFALHNDGETVRDIRGDRPYDKAYIREELSEIYGTWPDDIVLSRETREEVLCLISDESGLIASILELPEHYGIMPHDERPLCEFYVDDLDEAMNAEEARLTPHPVQSSFEP